MSKILYSSVLLLTLCCLISPALSQVETTTSNEKREAGKAWEALIKTKGGREKLYSINNMLTEWKNYARLDVFPNRNWWFGYYPVVNTPGIGTMDGAKSKVYFADNRGTGESKFDPEDLDGAVALDRIPFLLETKWDKPELLRVRSIKDGKKNLDVIETKFKKYRIDFIYEQEEMNVSQIDFIDEQNVVWQSYSFLNYREIDGIKMPQMWALDFKIDPRKKTKFSYSPIKFTFNVEYNPNLFEPPFKITIDGWKLLP